MHERNIKKKKSACLKRTIKNCMLECINCINEQWTQLKLLMEIIGLS